MTKKSSKFPSPISEDSAALHAVTRKANNTTVLPESLAAVAFIDAPTFAAAAGICISQLYCLIRIGEAPQPLRFGPRCVRWKLGTVKAWLVERAEMAAADADIGPQNVARSAKASAAAKTKRAATSMVAG